MFMRPVKPGRTQALRQNRHCRMRPIDFSFFWYQRFRSVSIDDSLSRKHDNWCTCTPCSSISSSSSGSSSRSLQLVSVEESLSRTHDNWYSDRPTAALVVSAEVVVVIAAAAAVAVAVQLQQHVMLQLQQA